MRELQLLHGRVALVDDQDYERASEFKWWANIQPNAVYARTKVNGKWIYLHRFIAGAVKGEVIDHVDRDGLNNQRLNLRRCSQSLNLANKVTKPHSSKFKGVSFEKARGKWVAYCKVNRKTTYIGSFDVEEDAAKAYNAKAQELYGSYARLNAV